CVMFPALDAKAAGFNVYAVMDASGDPTEFVSRTTLARFTQAGIVPTSTNVVICELHRTWRRPEAAEIAEIYTVATPNYRAVMESYRREVRVGWWKKGGLGRRLGVARPARPRNPPAGARRAPRRCPTRTARQ